MAFALNYDQSLSRVEITQDGLPVMSDPSLRKILRVERSTNQIAWTPVRGGNNATVDTSGEMRLYDYEFVPSNPSATRNYYQTLLPSVTDDFGRTVSDGWGTAPTGDTWTVVSTAADYFVGSGIGSMVHPDAAVNNYRYAHTGTSTVAPRVSASVRFPETVTGGEVWVGVMGRFVDGNNFTAARILLSTAGTATLQITERISGTTHVRASYALGTHFPLAWYRIELSLSENVGRARAWIVGTTKPSEWLAATDELAALSSGEVGCFTIRLTGNSNTDSITNFDDFIDESAYFAVADGYVEPEVEETWVKSVQRPFLNRPTVVQDVSEINYSSRGVAYPIAGRSDPIGATELLGPPQFQITFLTENYGDRGLLNYLLASGDTIYLQAGPSCVAPTGHYLVLGVNELRPARRTERRLHEVELMRVVKPGPSVVGATITWAGVLAAYADWADLLADNASWGDLLMLVSDPEEVIVP